MLSDKHRILLSGGFDWLLIVILIILIIYRIKRIKSGNYKKYRKPIWKLTIFSIFLMILTFIIDLIRFHWVQEFVRSQEKNMTKLQMQENFYNRIESKQNIFMEWRKTLFFGKILSVIVYILFNVGDLFNDWKWAKQHFPTLYEPYKEEIATILWYVEIIIIEIVLEMMFWSRF